MKPGVEEALKALMDMSTKAIKMRVLKKPDAPVAAEVEVESEGEPMSGENEVGELPANLSEEDVAMISEALEKMKGA